MKKMSSIIAVASLAAVPFLFAWSEPSAAAGSNASGRNWDVDEMSGSIEFGYVPCIGEALNVDWVIVSHTMLVERPSGGSVQRLFMSLEGTATGQNSGDKYTVRAQEMDGTYEFLNGSSKFTTIGFWTFTPVNRGVKIIWEMNAVLKWAGEPWASEPVFSMVHNGNWNNLEWGLFTHCTGPRK
jgi:hypothetical protein